MGDKKKKTFEVSVEATITVTGLYLVEATSEEAAEILAQNSFENNFDIELESSDLELCDYSFDVDAIDGNANEVEEEEED